MWKLFYTKEKDYAKAMKNVSLWKKEIFESMENKVKHYFAQKVVMNFDNMMIFNHKKGIHNNLMESLSTAEKEMQEVFALFHPVTLFLIEEESGTVAIVCGLEQEFNNSFKKYGFDLLKDDAVPMNNKEEEMRHLAWETLVFDVDLVNYAKGWINYSPSIEKRSSLQAEYILMNMHFKKGESTLLERITFEKNIRVHPQYEELFQKVLRIMPKIQTSMEQEWTTGTAKEKSLDTIGKTKKSKKI